MYTEEKSADRRPYELVPVEELVVPDLVAVVAPLPEAASAATELCEHVEAAAGLATKVASAKPQADEAEDCCE